MHDIHDCKVWLVKAKTATRIDLYEELTTILTYDFGLSRGSVEIVRSSKGKPSLKGKELALNLAHSGGYGLIGVSESREVGVDLELVRPGYDFGHQVNDSLTADEKHHLESLSAHDRYREFLRFWTRKEACLKCLGIGIAVDLSSLDVIAESIQWQGHPDVVLTDLQLPLGMVGCVALQ